MPSLPIPMISSIFLGFLLVRVWFIDRRHGPLVVLLGLCAVQGVIISMAQHYGVSAFMMIQPVTATFVPPMAWVAFQTTALRNFSTQDYLNILGPICALVSLVVAPNFLDSLIPALSVGYGVAILWVSLQGTDAMPRMRLDAGDLPSYIWQIIGAALIAAALSDVLIVTAQLMGAPHLQPWIISLYSSAMLLIVGGLSLSSALDTDITAADEPPEPPVSDQDVEILGKLDELMVTHQLYLNPDLTLSLLSRRLLVPAKQLSSAINRSTGSNVSRYINAARIKTAQDRLIAGDTITNAMLSSGFNTKSNFNREFLRVSGKNPSDWLVDQNTGNTRAMDP
ncbi:MAG: helix-turn-helix domain-containing protein [Pseudoruegeria sp.]